MARSVWKGSIAFGLVNIPVELHTAVRENRPRFKLLHATDKSPVSYERVCQREGKPVAWEDLVKGYEYEKGRFVTLTKDDFRAAALEKSKSIAIQDFVEPHAIDDRYFETPYYLIPAKGAAQAYALLREALRKAGRVGIAKIILRESEHLCAVEAIENALVLTMMRFEEEVVDIASFEFPSKSEARAKEVDMAVQLVEHLAAEWDPTKYKDEYRDNLMGVIDAKLKGEKIEVPAETRERPSNVLDLMSRLQRSLEQAGAQQKSEGRRQKGTATTAKASKATKPRKRAKVA
ncbi:MAG: Ku protein [Acidobacteriota bacterium]|nr:Ku protein [Acidobacteriota bacterium]